MKHEVGQLGKRIGEWAFMVCERYDSVVGRVEPHAFCNDCNV